MDNNGPNPKVLSNKNQLNVFKEHIHIFLIKATDINIDQFINFSYLMIIKKNLSLIDIALRDFKVNKHILIFLLNKAK